MVIGYSNVVEMSVTIALILAYRRTYTLTQLQDNTPLLMTLTEYLKSDKSNYLFDSSFECDAPEMNDDYTVPSPFADCLDYIPRDLIDGIDRRWLIIGRTRFQGGSNLHQDPLEDSWNTLLEGRKKWIIIQPNEQHDHELGRSLLTYRLHYLLTHSYAVIV